MSLSIRAFIFIIILVITLASCTGSQPAAVETMQPSQAATATIIPPTPTETASPTPIPLVSITASVWSEQPLVPILNFHQFMDDEVTPSSTNGHKMQLRDLRASLENLYQGGFSLVSLEKWLAGDLQVPAGRRPLIFTMDDLFFRNQIVLDKDGQPDPESGIGLIWQFSQEHPDFGFHLSLFSILGDKYYPVDPGYDPNWETLFGQTLVWLIEHDALVYNHTYRHGYLALTDKPVSMETFIEQLTANDLRLRELLAIVGREDLIPRLGNIIALPGGGNPQSEADWESLRAYQNPEGVPVQAVMQVYSAASDPLDLTYLTSPFDPAFDRYMLPRITGTLYYIQYVVDQRDMFPVSQTCDLELDETRLDDPSYLLEQIQSAVQTDACPPGIYMLEGQTFDVRAVSAASMGFIKSCFQSNNFLGFYSFPISC